MDSNSINANRFREVILSGTWIANTNLKAQLLEMRFEFANKKFGNLNTIAILTQHLHYYISGINTVFEGGTLDIRDKCSFNFPEVTSQKQWIQILDKLWIDSEKFSVFLENLPNEKLKEAFVDEKYGTYQRNIDGMIEHAYYHLGQIVLIKKLLLAQTNS